MSVKHLRIIRRSVSRKRKGDLLEYECQLPEGIETSKVESGCYCQDINYNKGDAKAHAEKEYAEAM